MNGSPMRARGHATLVNELDDRLPRASQIPPPGGVANDVRRRTLPTWLGMMAIVGLFIGAAWIAVQPAGDSCRFDETICSIQHLDIDALLLAVPDADLFDLLPAIDEIDPDDSLTLGDVLDLEGVREVDPTTLLTPSEIDRVLDHLD